MMRQSKAYFASPYSNTTPYIVKATSSIDSQSRCQWKLWQRVEGNCLTMSSGVPKRPLLSWQGLWDRTESSSIPKGGDGTKSSAHRDLRAQNIALRSSHWYLTLESTGWKLRQGNILPILLHFGQESGSSGGFFEFFWRITKDVNIESRLPETGQKFQRARKFIP